MPTCLACPPFHPVEQPPKLRIVIYGELFRGIGRGGSCHGDLNNNGTSFARGAAGGLHEGSASGLRIRQRNNDISQPMRNIALDHAERFEEAAGYDASPTPNVLKAVGYKGAPPKRGPSGGLMLEGRCYLLDPESDEDPVDVLCFALGWLAVDELAFCAGELPLTEGD